MFSLNLVVVVWFVFHLNALTQTVLVCSGCDNSIPQAGSLSNDRNLFLPGSEVDASSQIFCLLSSL